MMHPFLLVYVLLTTLKNCNGDPSNGIIISTYQTTTKSSDELYSSDQAIDGKRFTAAITRNQSNPHWQISLKSHMKFEILRISGQLAGEGEYEFIVGDLNGDINSSKLCKKVNFVNEISEFSERCTRNVLGNSIWIRRKIGLGSLILYEVKLQDPSNGIIISTYQTTTKSSDELYSSDQAIDGKRFTAAITRNQSNPHWQISLKSHMKFEILRISGQLAGEGEYEFIVGDLNGDINSSKLCKKVNFVNEISEFSERCTRNVLGNSIWIRRKIGLGSLILYEVKLQVCTSQSSSPKCFNCSKSCVDYHCNTMTDNCPAQCSNGLYSLSCGKCTHWNSDASCHRQCKTCLNGECGPSFGTCSSCVGGKFGHRCENDCSNACYGGHCRQLTGECISCSTGVYGDKCETKCAEDKCSDMLCLNRTRGIESSCFNTCSQETMNSPEKNNVCTPICRQNICLADDRPKLTDEDDCSYCVNKIVRNIDAEEHNQVDCGFYTDQFCKMSCQSPCKTCLLSRQCTDCPCHKSEPEEDISDTFQFTTILIYSGSALFVILFIGALVFTLKRCWRRRHFKPPTPDDFEDDESARSDSDFDLDNGDDSATVYLNEEALSKISCSSMADLQSARYTPMKRFSISQFTNFAKSLEYRERMTEEYNSLPKGLIENFSEAMKPFNRCLNRFRGLYPYNFNRVVLESATRNSDYINASYVHGYKSEKRYVAAQGPFTEKTVISFWRMVWQVNCPIIVMLTQLDENGVMKYWPENEVQHGNITIVTKSQQVFRFYTVRTFEISTSHGKKDVTQFHFTSWPRKGVPSNKLSLNQFRDAVRAHPIQSSPLVVHCSGGVGRTGTFMAFDYLMDEVENEGSIDIYHCVCRMRRERTYVIQSYEQYEYLCEVLAETLNRLFVMSIAEQELYD